LDPADRSRGEPPVPHIAERTQLLVPFCPTKLVHKGASPSDIGHCSRCRGDVGQGLDELAGLVEILGEVFEDFGSDSCRQTTEDGSAQPMSVQLHFLAKGRRITHTSFLGILGGAASNLLGKIGSG